MNMNYNMSPISPYNQPHFQPSPPNPIKLLPSTNVPNNFTLNPEKNVNNMNNRERLKQKSEMNSSNLAEKNQRSFSSKNKYEKPNTSGVVSNPKHHPSLDRAQNTHPDSFSNANNRNNKSTLNENDTSYHPYTLKEYKELNNGKVVLGGLGPNIGTKDWEEKHKKMRKITQYAENVKSLHHEKLKPIKENPLDIIERERREKVDASTRNKASEYAKKIKKIKVTKYRHDMIYDHGNYGQNNQEFNAEQENNTKVKNDGEDFAELQKKREFLAQQVNAFKDDILK